MSAQEISTFAEHSVQPANERDPMVFLVDNDSVHVRFSRLVKLPNRSCEDLPDSHTHNLGVKILDTVFEGGVDKLKGFGTDHRPTTFQKNQEMKQTINEYCSKLDSRTLLDPVERVEATYGDKLPTSLRVWEGGIVFGEMSAEFPTLRSGHDFVQDFVDPTRSLGSGLIKFEPKIRMVSGVQKYLDSTASATFDQHMQSHLNGVSPGSNIGQTLYSFATGRFGNVVPKSIRDYLQEEAMSWFSRNKSRITLFDSQPADYSTVVLSLLHLLPPEWEWENPMEQALPSPAEAGEDDSSKNQWLENSLKEAHQALRSRLPSSARADLPRRSGDVATICREVLEGARTIWEAASDGKANCRGFFEVIDTQFDIGKSTIQARVQIKDVSDDTARGELKPRLIIVTFFDHGETTTSIGTDQEDPTI